MIYYTNSDLTKPHMTFIGRWSPLHAGHIAIMEKKRTQHPNLPVLIMVRNTPSDAYSPIQRAAYVKAWMIEKKIRGTIMIIPNVEGVYWGRDVGYHVGAVAMDKKSLAISGTHIRRAIHEGSTRWERLVATESAAYMLTPKTSSIMERGHVVWLTGCPSSGKTTIASLLRKKLTGRYPHMKIQVLDGDDMRASPMAQHVGFTPAQRADHILRMAYLAKLFADQGIFVICAFVSPNRKIRHQAKYIVGLSRFTEVYVKATRLTRISRDTKGYYKKARQGKLSNLTGYNAPYEASTNPGVTCNTDKETPGKSADKILSYVLQ